MKKYYYNNGANQGPVTEADLKQLFAEGQISANTHILEVGTKQWVKYKEVFSTASTTADTAASEAKTAATIQYKEVFNKISKESAKYAETITAFDYNRSIDPIFAKILRLPPFLNTDEARSTYYTFGANAGSILCWMSFVFFSCSSLPDGTAFGTYLLVFFISLIVGFFIQKLFYHCYKMTAEALSAKKVQLGSLDFPRIGMVLSLMMGICLLFMFLAVLFIGKEVGLKDELLGGVASTSFSLLVSAFVFILLATIFANAPIINAEVVKKTLTPGLYFVNMLRYLINTVSTTIQILIPLLLFSYIISTAIPEFEKEENAFDTSAYERKYSTRYSEDRSFRSHSSYKDDDDSIITGVLSSEGAVFFLPLINLVLLFGGSVPLDVIASLMSNGKQRRPEDELSEEDSNK